MDVIGYEGEEK